MKPIFSKEIYSIKYQLEFTPLEFETWTAYEQKPPRSKIRIYSVGVWNYKLDENNINKQELEFTPLEFETIKWQNSPKKAHD